MASEPDSVWPSIFRHPRVFNRHTENLPYLRNLDLTELDSDSDDENWGPDSDDESDSGFILSNDALTDNEADLGKDVCKNPPSVVRRFASGIRGEDSSTHLGQEDTVAKFVENFFARSATEAQESSRLVAIVDDSSNIADSGSPRRLPTHRRGLKLREFHERLSKPVRDTLPIKTKGSGHNTDGLVGDSPQRFQVPNDIGTSTEASDDAAVLRRLM